MFLAKVLKQIKARSRLCLRNVLCFPELTQKLTHTHTALVSSLCKAIKSQIYIIL